MGYNEVTRENARLEDARMLILHSRDAIKKLLFAAEANLSYREADEEIDHDDPEEQAITEELQAEIRNAKWVLSRVEPINHALFAAGDAPRTAWPIIRLKEHHEAWRAVKQLSNLMATKEEA